MLSLFITGGGLFVVREDELDCRSARRYSYSLLWCYQACSMNSLLRWHQNANPIDRAGANKES